VQRVVRQGVEARFYVDPCCGKDFLAEAQQVTEALDRFRGPTRA
jgi:hypothetical protein